MTPVPSVSAVILARDAEHMIGHCLNSVGWATERLVMVDTATTDATAERALAHGARVVHRALTTFADQRDAALAEAAGTWVLFVDADERVPEALATEVQAAIASPGDVVGFWVPRRNIIRGRWIRTAGWYPDHQLRLLRRGSTRYLSDLPVHEVATLDGPDSYLTEPLLHLNYRTIQEFWTKQRRYAALAAQGMRQRGERPRARALIGQPAREFWRRFVTQAGYREGPLGLALCGIMAIAIFETQWRARRGR